MKKQTLFFLILVAMGNVLFAQMQTKGVFVCNEGVWNMGNSTIAYLDFETKQNDLDYFFTKNQRSIGDTPNDIQIYGSKVYVVVNVSSQIEVFDVNTGKSVKQIPMFDGSVSRQPRCITFHENKAYVSSFDGTISRIDTTSLTIDGTASAGRNSESICVAGNKLYVANSGGLDGYTSGSYDNTVSVIDIHSFSEIKKIEVGTNPYKVLPDEYGNVYVSIRGNYNDIPYSFKRIDTSTQKVEETFSIECLSFAIQGRYAYLYNYDYSNNSSWIKRFNLETKTLEMTNFITDGTTVSYPYGISVNPANGDVYVTNAGENFTTEGDLFCFGSNGKLKFKVADVGVGPNGVVFFNVETAATGICETYENTKKVSIYPNPVTENIYIENAALSTVCIFDQKGNTKGNYKLQSNNEKVNIQHFPAGIYFITLTEKNKI